MLTRVYTRCVQDTFIKTEVAVENAHKNSFNKVLLSLNLNNTEERKKLASQAADTTVLSYDIETDGRSVSALWIRKRAQRPRPK